MSEETENGTQTFDCSSETIETELKLELSETHDTELTLMPGDGRIKQATDPILKRVEKLCALLASRTDMRSAGNNEVSASRRDHWLSSPSRNWSDMVRGVQTNSHRRT